MATAGSKFSSTPLLMAGAVSVLALMPVGYFESIQREQSANTTATASVLRVSVESVDSLDVQLDQLPLNTQMDWASEAPANDRPVWMTEDELASFENKYKNELEQSISSVADIEIQIEPLSPVRSVDNTSIVKQPQWMQQDLRVAREAQALFEQHRAPQAQKQLRAFIEQHPQSKWSRIRYIQFLFKQQLWDRAYEQILAALEATNQDRAFVKLQARWYVNHRAFAKAYQVLETYNPVAMQTDVDAKNMTVAAVVDPEFIALQAALSQQTKQFAKAVYLYETLIDVQPTQFDYWLGLAAALDAMQQKQKAYYAYTSALNMVSQSDKRLTVIERNQHLWRYAAMRRYKLKQDISSNVNL